MDEWILRTVNAWSQSRGIALLGLVLSSRWMLVVVLGPLLTLFLQRRRFAAILTIGLAMGSSDLVTARVLKPWFERPRPCRALVGVHAPAGCGPGRSFPSGHAAVSFAFLTSAAPVVPFGWAMFGPLAASVAGSRVLLGVHYPSDVAAGAVLGSVIGILFGRLRRRIESSDRFSRCETNDRAP